MQTCFKTEMLPRNAHLNETGMLPFPRFTTDDTANKTNITQIFKKMNDFEFFKYF